MQDRNENSLVNAINANNVKQVELLLKEKHTLQFRDFNFMRCNNVTREMLALLDKYNALPKDLSMSTLKFHLYYRGNRNISQSEFIDQPDLNLGKCAGFISPMDIFAYDGKVRGVKWLMNKSIQERPIYLFNGIHESHFHGIDLLDPDASKKRVKNNLSGKGEAPDSNIVNKCKIVELFLKYPTDDLDKKIEEDLSDHHGQMSLLPFFMWAAVNNRADLFDTEYFNVLLNKYPDARDEAVKIAAAFNAKDFIRKIITSLDYGVIRGVLRVAIAVHNQEVLEDMIQTLNKSGISLKDVSHISLSEESSMLRPTRSESPLFWAVRTKNLEAVNYLIKNGIDPNRFQDFGFDDSYLHLAIRGKNIFIVKALLDHGANPHHKDGSKTTPLHQACKLELWDVAELLIRNNASLSELDDRNMSPLDYIKDENFKKRLSALVEEKAPAQHMIYSPKSQFKLFDAKEVLAVQHTEENKHGSKRRRDGSTL